MLKGVKGRGEERRGGEGKLSEGPSRKIIATMTSLSTERTL